MSENIPREHYMEILRQSKDTPAVKVLTGIRRSGKSTLLEMFREELKASGISESDIFYLDLDIDRPDNPKDHSELTRMVTEAIDPVPGKYIFLDEVQNVKDWDISVTSFFTAGADVYITGSNSETLSSEISTKLSGRSLPIHVMPLSFSEYTGFRKPDIPSDILFRDYVMTGGMPAVARLVDTPAANIIPSLLYGTFSTVYVKDIEERHDIKGFTRMSNLVKYVMRNIGDRISARKSSDYLKSKGVSISHVTLEDYLGYMEEAFLVYRAQRIDSKTKEYLDTSDKFYASDLGIRNTVVPYRWEDMDGLLENIVYNELRFRYPEVAVCRTGDHEIDFIADPRGKPSYYQVSLNISDPKTLEREVRPLKEIKDNYPKYIITYDRYLLDDIDGIHVMQIIDWLLGR